VRLVGYLNRNIISPLFWSVIKSKTLWIKQT